MAIIQGSRLQIKWKIIISIILNRCSFRDRMSRNSIIIIWKPRIINMILGCRGLWISLYIRTPLPKHFLTTSSIKTKCQNKIHLILLFIPVQKALNISFREKWQFKLFILYILIRKITLFCPMYNRITHHHHFVKNKFRFLIIILKIS